MHVRVSFKTVALAAGLALPACSLVFPGSLLAQGMGSMNMPGGKTGSGAAVAPSQVFDKLLSSEEKEIVDAAEAMPADKFNFAPSSSMGTYDGVKTFSAQVKHLASANYGMFHSFNVPGGKSRAELDKLNSRDEILAALKDSYKYAHTAIATITPANAFTDMDGKGGTRAGTAAYAMVHANDHYGQMVEYLRMNGIIPPASRK